MQLRDRLAPPERFDTAEGNLADCAYDLTLSKYTHFPTGLRKREIDCRKYFQAFLHKMQEEIQKEKIIDPVHEESCAGALLQNLVLRNFRLSQYECKRDTKLSIRYAWKVKGVRIYLWRPTYMAPKELRAWLEENFKDIDPKEPEHEQRRIQFVIDEVFGKAHHVSFDLPGVAKNLGIEQGAHSIELQEGHNFVNDLAKAVATDKLENIDSLRPAIKKLGKKKLEQLILQIFSELSKGEYNLSQIAKQYGISKSTLSRFAGSQWSENRENTEVTIIPDLWQNTAKILSGNPVFMETVLISGVAGEVEKVLTLIKDQEGSGNG
jgi:hypothetical protein